MITNITLENFKCFRKVEVNPRRITVFIGPNGSGKSSVLQALALLKQSDGDEKLNVQGRVVNLHSYERLRPQFAPYNRSLRLSFSGSYQRPPQPLEGEDIETWQGEDVKAVGFSCEAESVDGTLIPKHKDHIMTRLVTHALEKFRFVPAARGLVRPVYNLGPQVYENISPGGQETETVTNLAYARQLESKLSNWLKQVTGVGLRVDLVPSQSVEVNTLTSSGDVNIVAEGFGTNALILLFLQLVSAEKGATVMIEEPEIHLHPKAQAELASLLVEEAQAEDKQVIMTTHSEHILSRLLTLVAENKLSVDELAIYAFEKDEKGECSASQIKVFEDGRVQGGIKDFFDTNLVEMNRYVQAQFSRLQPEE